MTEPTAQELCALETFQPNVAEHLRAQARAANDHREKHLRARSDWRDGQQAIAWCRGRIAHLEAELANATERATKNWALYDETRAELDATDRTIAALRSELATMRSANVALSAGGADQLGGFMAERDGILRDYQIESDTCVRDIVERTTAAACRFRDELTAARSDLASLVSSLPRCQHCPNPATYAWHGGEELACDDHVPPAVASSTGFSLPYAARLRALSGRP